MRTSEISSNEGIFGIKTVNLIPPHCKNCDALKKRIKELEAELDKHRCPICHRIGCQSDHGYGAGGGDWG